MTSATAPAHEVVIVPSPGELDREKLRKQCYDVRIAVFVDEQQFPLDVEIDEFVTFLKASTSVEDHIVHYFAHS
jgi:predicted GNAT family N-acyltransferase